MERMWNEVKQWFTTENNRRLAVQRAQYHPALESQSPNIAAMEKAA